MAVWLDYYEHFNIKKDSVRPGCEPRIMIQCEIQPPGKAIVLIHGLTDSPYWMVMV